MLLRRKNLNNGKSFSPVLLYSSSATATAIKNIPIDFSNYNLGYIQFGTYGTSASNVSMLQNELFLINGKRYITIGFTNPETCVRSFIATKSNLYLSDAPYYDTFLSMTETAYTRGNVEKNIYGMNVSMKHLWTNLNPTNSFSAQTINMPNILNYNLILIEFAVSDTSSTDLTTRWNGYRLAMDCYSPNYKHVHFNFAKGMSCCRGYVINKNSIVFDDNYYSSAYNKTPDTKLNTYNIPTNIYGIY